ncbi:MAG: DUF4249 domain-containing protein [Cytophagales bacterium]|nr:DUF4249 domain-containing protein [Cytophagales bacterium]
MNIHEKIRILIAVAVFLNACLPDPLEVDGIPVPEEQVVVGAQLIPDQFIAVSLSRNFNALEAGPDSDLDSILQDILMPGIDVKLTANNTDYTMAELFPGIYGINDVPQEPGTRYRLSFINPVNGQSTHADAIALPFVGFAEVQPKMHLTSYDTLLRISFRIQDPPGPNWYMVNAQPMGRSFDLSERPFTQVYDESDVEGSILEDEFTVFFRDFSSQDTVLVSMANISREYFEFLELRDNHQRLWLDALGEPVNYPTNVHNGLGFFNVHVPDIRFFLLEDL